MQGYRQDLRFVDNIPTGAQGACSPRYESSHDCAAVGDLEDIGTVGIGEGGEVKQGVFSRLLANAP
jgi:hypothetical protein